MNAIAQARPTTWTTGQIEVLKWLAVAAMVVDHINAALYARELGTWADVIGRIAFPVFACVFGHNLARPGVDLAKVIRWLVLFGTVAFPVHAYLFATAVVWPLNVLFTFAVAAGVIHFMERDETLPAVLLFVLGGLLVEYWWPGVALVVATYGWTKYRHQSGWWAAMLSLGALCVLNGNLWALLMLPVAEIVRGFTWANVPRSRWAFYLFYPLHLAVLAAIVGLT